MTARARQNSADCFCAPRGGAGSAGRSSCGGSGASGIAIGSINVVTKQPEQPFAETNIDYGQYENYTLNMAQGAPVGDAYFWITGTRMKSGGY